jgi:transposase
MNDIIRIGVDTSKSVFQLHGVDAAERPVLRKKLRRRDFLNFFAKLPPTRVGLEACGGSHYWARELMALRHEPKLLPTQHVKPYVRRNKNDRKDADAVCEAMSRPRMTFVRIKSAEEQAAQMLMTTRQRLIDYRTQLINTIRGHAAEFGHGRQRACPCRTAAEARRRRRNGARACQRTVRHARPGVRLPQG